MEGAESNTKKRVLPLWMTEDKAKNLRSPPKKPKKKEIFPRKRTVYCMSEMELVEYALQILHESRGQKRNDVTIIPETSEESESEMEPNTLPSKATCSHVISTSPSKDLENNQLAPQTNYDSDDDPLKFVREIFFS
ncbi:cell cycle regulator of non-homologous end joining [Bombina bombina]|uniref:cell cycle regulator of non-homologous end joining n=1 Tax=Bombina bombina TaxID=8345 RepID=UPI00235A5993|nr:cell cycle regulator of non-homologous end joining [Bombina bombina]XP_053574950.1 cell cycle regulator of non-homologous end joining [Bombina bombina]